jgi:hypothetical protein
MKVAIAENIVVIKILHTVFEDLIGIAHSDAHGNIQSA